MTDTPPVATRRKLWLTSIDDAIAEINRLRAGGYARRGNWSLAQICSHLRSTIESNLTPPETDEPTADEIATREKFFGMAMNPDGMPANMPLPADRVPAETTPDDQIDGLIVALKNLRAYAHKCVKVGRCGPVPIDQVIKLHLAHVSHHLSFLEPNPAGGLTPDGRPRRLRFKTDAELKAEIESLRKNPYEKTGNWNLQQMARHLAIPIEMALDGKVDGTIPTSEEIAAQLAVLEPYFQTGGPAAGTQTPPPLVPADDCSDAEVDRLLTAISKLMTDERPVLNWGRFGPIPTERLREFHRIHAAHHLSHLKPKKRRRLRYADEESVIADVNNLRRGYAQHGKWNLQQVCWHLSAGVKMRMACPDPIPANTPEQDGRRSMIQKILADGLLPNGLTAPDPMTPAADTPESAIDEFIETLKKFVAYTGPIAPHRLFGNLADAEARRLNRIHCAHHLSYLEPNFPCQGPMLKKGADYRKVRLTSIEAALAEIEQLKAGHQPTGNWDLPMVARHISTVLGRSGMKPPANPTPTPEQTARKKGFVDVVLATGRPPEGMMSPMEFTPSWDSSPADVDRLEQLLKELAAFEHPLIDMGPFGPVPIHEFKALQLGHLAHHLGFLVPVPVPSPGTPGGTSSAG